MTRRDETDPREPIGLLVQCPFCLAPRGNYCTVKQTRSTRNIGKSTRLHKGRYLAGLKWQEWHKGIAPLSLDPFGNPLGEST